MKKIEAISYLRIAAMMMVVFYHCICCYAIWNNRFASVVDVHLWDICAKCLSSVHVPLFLIISGFLYTYKRTNGGYKNTLEYLKSRFLRIGIPYIVWGAFFASITLYSWSSFLNGMAHLWFLMVLLECCVVGRILDFCWLNQIGTIVVGILSALYLLYIPHMDFYADTLCFGSFLRYVPYYMVGCCLGTHSVLSKIQDWKSKWSIFVTILLFVLFIMANTRYLKIVRPFISTAFMVMLLLMGLQYINHVGECAKNISDCCMGMYIIHQPIIQGLSLIPYVARFRDIHYYLYPVLLFVVLMPVVGGEYVFFAQPNYSEYYWGKIFLKT